MSKRLILTTLLTAGLAFSQCIYNPLQKEEEDQTTELILLVIINNLLIGPAGDATYISRSNTGLTAWDIGLATGNLSYIRNLGSSSVAHSPANWITVTDSTCVAKGVPSDMIDSCSLTGGTIGVCQTRFLSTGEIVDTTLLLLDSFQTGSDSEAEKQSVFTHEIGHCLGLQHSGSGLDIMFANTSGANNPSINELAAMDEAYNPTVQNPTTNAARFQDTGGNVVRHFSFPVFTISYNIGSAFTTSGQEKLPPKGKDYGVPLMVRNHYFHADGTCSGDHDH